MPHMLGMRHFSNEQYAGRIIRQLDSVSTVVYALTEVSGKPKCEVLLMFYAVTSHLALRDAGEDAKEPHIKKRNMEISYFIQTDPVSERS